VGLAEATLRLPANHPDYTGELVRAFSELYEIYGRGSFDTVATANVILKKHGERSYSVFYGMDFGKEGPSKRDFSMTTAVTVRDLADVYNLRTDFSAEDFQDIFYGNFEESNVSIYGLINTVYIMRRFLPQFDSQHTTRRGVTLY
jgi:hypothetical protein